MHKHSKLIPQKSQNIFSKHFQNLCSDTNCNIPKEYYFYMNIDG